MDCNPSGFGIDGDHLEQRILRIMKHYPTQTVSLCATDSEVVLGMLGSAPQHRLYRLGQLGFSSSFVGAARKIQSTGGGSISGDNRRDSWNR